MLWLHLIGMTCLFSTSRAGLQRAFAPQHPGLFLAYGLASLSSNNWISHAGWKSFKLALFLAERACQLIGEWLEEIRNRRALAGLNKGLDGHTRNKFEPAQLCAGLIVDLDPHNIVA